MDKKERDKYIIESNNLINREIEFFVNTHNLKSVMSKEEIEDMKGEALIVMCENVERFDTNRGVKFSTWAQPRIVGVFKDFLMKGKKARIGYANYLEEVYSTLDNIHALPFCEASSLLSRVVLPGEMEGCSIPVNGGNQEIIEIFDSISRLPEFDLYLVVSYYIIGKNTVELSKELGFAPNSGWVGRLIQKSTQQLKEQIQEKMNEVREIE